MRTIPIFLTGAAALAMAASLTANTADAATRTVTAPAPVIDAPLKTGATQTAVFAGGCFWGLEGVFEHVKGVRAVTSGYAGGNSLTAHYEVVGTGATGHAESVKIEYDPAQVSYGTLLRVYFSVATDPTQLNHQDPDDGSQYRGTVFAQTPEQAKLAAAYIAQLSAAKVWPAKIVTTIETGKAFYAAEGYHQNFLNQNPNYPYIVVNDMPKVAALKKLFPTLWSEKSAA